MKQSTPGGGRVRVWTFSLGVSVPDMRRLDSILSENELITAARRASGRPRAEYLATRVAVRSLLAQHLGERPGNLRFTTSPDGKPEVVDATTHFNVSHSNRLGLLAVSDDAEVGVDVEHVDAGLDVDALAPRVLGADEASGLARAGSLRTELFYRYWTCKESYLKGIGCGLRRAPAEVEIRFAGRRPGRPGSARVTGGDTWSVLELLPAARYVAAVATREPLSHIELADWTSNDERIFPDQRICDILIKEGNHQ